jgi:hypothetical protein
VEELRVDSVTKRVVAFTPYGRKSTVSILAEYLRRDHERGILDEWWLCLNTDADQVGDLRYAYELARMYSWVKLKERPKGVARLHPKQRNTGYFYRYMTDPDTVYVRFDDDIIFVDEHAIERLVTARIRMQGTALTTFGLIWNNSICSYFLQRHGKIPEDSEEGSGPFKRIREPYCMDPIGWADGEFAVALHELLLDRLEGAPYIDGDEVQEVCEPFFLYQDVPLAPRQQFSVSFFAVSGEDYRRLSPPGVLDYPEEEHWHTVHAPERFGLGNVIVGDSLVSHYTFYPQGNIVRATNILERYRALTKEFT